MNTRTGMAKITSTNPTAAMLPRGPRLATASDQVEARDEDREVLDLQREERHPYAERPGRRHGARRLHPSGWGRLGIGSDEQALFKPKTTSSPPTIALMTRPTAKAVLPVPPKRVSPETPITAQVAKYPSARAPALGRGLREPKNRMVRRSNGGAIEPPIVKTTSPGSSSLIYILPAVAPAWPGLFARSFARRR
jgi:hypothetical protein